MKRAIFASLLIVVACSALAGGSPLPGSWRWVPQVYSSLPTAAAGLAAGADDRLPATLIRTSDPVMPFVVFRWQFIDRCCSPIPDFYYLAGTEAQAVAQYQAWLSYRHSRVGIVTTGRPDVAFAWLIK